MTTTPGHWFHLSDRRFAFPVAIFDLDGVLSDASHRQHHLATDPPDWDGFGAGAHLDPPLLSGHGEVRTWGRTHLVAVLTARPASMAPVTISWFDRHELAIDLVVFRPDHDRRASEELKRDELERIRSLGGDVRVAFEDDPDNVRMYEAAGVRTIYVHSGYYDQGKAAP